MPEKWRISTLMDRQHVKVAETLHKSPSEYFCHILNNFEKKLVPKISFK